MPQPLADEVKAAEATRLKERPQQLLKLAAIRGPAEGPETLEPDLGAA